LPVLGRPVRLRVRTRRFFCWQPGCSQRSITERFPESVPSRGRKTLRMVQALQQIGLAQGGRGGSRLALRLGLLASFRGVLRLVREVPLPTVPTPRVLGVDDWALRRGRRYSTLLCDLEQHREVELLPDRTREALAAWLREHSGVEVVGRDRFEAYAEGIRQGAPQAVQGADRWHLLKNLVDLLRGFLDALRRLLRTAPEPAPEGSRAASAVEPSLPLPEGVPIKASRPLPRKQRLKAERRARRLGRWGCVRADYQAGLSLSEMARRTGMDYATVTECARFRHFLEITQRSRRPSQVDPFAGYLRQPWAEGCHNGPQLFREIQAEGYPGGATQVAAWLQGLRHPSEPMIRGKARSAPGNLGSGCFGSPRNASPRGRLC
jgi:hypothetical protein